MVANNQHDASIDNSALKIKGASRIRDFTALQATIADSNQVVGKPSYDDKWVPPSFTSHHRVPQPCGPPFHDL
jgi:hypothetical protein